MPIRLLCLLLAVTCSGCALTNPARDDTQQAADSPARGTAGDRTAKDEKAEDEKAEFEDEWAHVGDQTRELRSVERAPDRWFKKYFQSPKARAIERNLGIE